MIAFAMQEITCPFCGKEFEISRALSAKIEEQLLSHERQLHKKALEEATQKAKDSVVKKLQEQFTQQLKEQQGDARAKDERIKDLINQVTDLTREMRLSKREKEEAMLKMEKKLSEEEGKIRAEAQKKAEEEQHLKIAEKEKQLQDALAANEEMRRKLQQGSQQTQGEVFELEFESQLQQHYPNDKILPVGKGVKGGDIVQEVWDRNGNCAGKILWELKNTKTWSEGWIDKLKIDQRNINADEAVLISEVLPADIKIAGFKSNIWVTKRSFVIPLADTLRAKLIQLYYVKNSVQAKDAKMEVLYSYLSGTEFKHRIEAIIEAFTNMQEEIEKERNYFSHKWARDEKNIRQVIDSTYGMHGDLKGIIGSTLPQIKGLEFFDEKDGKN